jgi:translation initiation factor IF-2
MIMTVMAAALMVQGDPADSRTAFRNCLSDAVVSAKTANVTIDTFKDYAHKTCAAAESSLKSRLVNFNVKNGMSKKSAADDAEVQLEDYLYTYEEKFRYAAQPPQ